MGDWHGTCFASSLPIFEGEDCAAILMVRNPYDTRRNTYPDDRYFPITAPLRGKYNGYGGIIPVRDSNYEALEAFIKDYPVLLFAKEQDPSTGIPIQDLSAALDGAIHCGVILNSKEFPTRKGNLVVEMGLLHGKILSFAEKEYSKRIHSVERAIENIEMAAKETSFWSPKVLECEESLRYTLSDTGMSHSFLIRATRHGYNPASLAAVTAMLQNQRLRFIPGNGAGSQLGIELERQLSYYGLVHQIAEEVFYRSSNF